MIRRMVRMYRTFLEGRPESIKPQVIRLRDALPNEGGMIRAAGNVLNRVCCRIVTKLIVRISVPLITKASREKVGVRLHVVPGFVADEVEPVNTDDRVIRPVVDRQQTAKRQSVLIPRVPPIAVAEVMRRSLVQRSARSSATH
jgi:hypothetical protein